MTDLKRPVGSLPPSKPPPARHRPGARSARRERCLSIVLQTNLGQEIPMSIQSFFKSLTSPSTRRRPSRRRAQTSRLRLEALEDRTMPSTFTVTNLLDSGPDSLRTAVAAANANPGADAIDFAVTGTIGLTSGELDITDSLTINGPGAGALTVSGNQVSRVFGIAADPTVTIAGLTVAYGWSDSGGGIFMAGGTLTLDQRTVCGNSAGAAAG